ncbi:hypothetical protein TR2A62_2454 [Thalassobium sp. R2A62]|nr:hypothetical protein TR2A62_2454 [Thalassobium sp. R2A62]
MSCLDDTSVLLTFQESIASNHQILRNIMSGTDVYAKQMQN